MTQLDVSGRDVGEAMSQAEKVAVARSPSAASQGKETPSKPAASNKDGDKIVASGEITGVSTNSITVEGKTFAVVVETQLKYHGKAITIADVPVKLTAGKLYATVQGTKLSETTFRANVIVVQDTLGEAQQEQEREQSQEQEHANDIQQQISGNVTFVSSALLQISGFVPGIVLNADTKVEQVGAGTKDLADIKLGQSVQVHVLLSGTAYTAQQVHIEDKYVKPDTASSDDNDSQGTQPASNEQQARGKVTAVTATTLRIDGYAHDIVLTASSKVEQAGAGKSTVADIKVGQTVQVHVSLTGTTYTATQVHIEDKYVKPDKEANEQPTDISVTTWQGTVSGVFVQPGVNSASEQTIGVVVLTASGQQPTLYWILPTSVVQDTSSHTLTLAALQTLQGTAAQKVTIQGRFLADGTVDIVRIALTTDTGANPGKGNGKH
jgi:putative methionine-R-sulfoxide reductase with GAF domain